MAKCYFTGIDVPLHAAFVLDVARAFRALKDTKDKVIALERLIEQLSPWDEIKVFDHVKHEDVVKKNRRLVCEKIAAALSHTCPEEQLFIRWDEWRARKPVRNSGRWQP